MFLHLFTYLFTCFNELHISPLSKLLVTLVPTVKLQTLSSDRSQNLFDQIHNPLKIINLLKHYIEKGEEFGEFAFTEISLYSLQYKGKTCKV